MSSRDLRNVQIQHEESFYLLLDVNVSALGCPTYDIKLQSKSIQFVGGKQIMAVDSDKVLKL